MRNFSRLIGIVALASVALVAAPAAADPFDDLSKQLAKEHGIPDFQLDPSEFGKNPKQQIKTLAKELKYVSKHGYSVDYTAPVDGVPGTPGTPSKQKDWYKAPTGKTADPALWQNQCWTNARKVRKTAGTQGVDGVCIWNNGTLASLGVGGKPGTPGIPAVPRECTITGKKSYSC